MIPPIFSGPPPSARDHSSARQLGHRGDRRRSCTWALGRGPVLLPSAEGRGASYLRAKAMVSAKASTAAITQRIVRSLSGGRRFRLRPPSSSAITGGYPASQAEKRQARFSSEVSP